MTGRAISTPPERLAFYALGGGKGHFMRVLALIRAVHSLAPGVKTLMVVPDRLLELARRFGLAAAAPPCRDRQGLATWLDDRLSEFRPDGLVVDVFVRGVLGELGLCRHLPPRVLLGRSLHPEYHRMVRGALQDYRAVLWAEAAPAELRDPLRVDPVVVVQELLERERARHDLGLSPDLPAVLAIGTGSTRSQQRLLERLAFVPQLRLFSTELPACDQVVSRIPAGSWLLAADVVVSAAGYQSYHEIVQAGVPAVFVPQRRQIDDQAARAQGRLGFAPRASWRVAATPEELAGAVSELLVTGTRADPVRFSGAEQAARHVLKTLS
ncbi:MAG: hypothetical protein HY319_32275 [Armatimonadetes bacterium]|nr:hypothetical protein [Armatimonadota bacterium]